ncbi:MAG: DUF3237 family protein [Rhizobium sp.]|nr:DUF3237 family protein [Rhizobium sp.]
MSHEIVSPIVPGLEFAFVINVTIAEPRSGGRGRNGHRRIIPITGGTISGPRLQGRVLPGGADYELIRQDGCSVVTAHYGLEADDGTPIYIRNQGLFIADKTVVDRVDAGEFLRPEAYYFRSAPIFDAPVGPHVWLSDSLFVASCAFRMTDVTIAVYRVT